jgi:hypothetical protein
MNLRIQKENLNKYIDGVVISFLFIFCVGLIGAFLG